MRNLSAIGKACALYEMDHSDVPPTAFGQIAEMVQSRKIFVCPSTKRRPGPGGSVDDWTDYILVTNASATNRHVRAYCKPENHKGEGCNVLFTDGSVEWVRVNSFSNLACDVQNHARLVTGEAGL